jgi:16S rRNA processing protein RimM
MQSAIAQDYVVLGKVTAPYGIKGWLKIFSYTEPMDQILDYENWLLRKGVDIKQVTVVGGRSHGKGMVAQLAEVADRNASELLGGYEILVHRDQLPELADGEFYWFQLEGLRVKNRDGVDLGVVSHLISAGSANDVLVVQGDQDSLDREERLIPYLPDQGQTDVDLNAGLVTVDWDPEF